MLHSHANSRVKRPQDFGYKKPPKQRFKGWPRGVGNRETKGFFLVSQRKGVLKEGEKEKQRGRCFQLTWKGDREGFPGQQRRSSACLFGEKKAVFVIREEGVPRAFVFSLCNFRFG